MKKTNAMRILDQRKITYVARPWADVPLNHVPKYKTLVTIGKSGENYVFVVPIDYELDLKKAANATNEKHIHMLKEKDLLPLTGYIHGGCSPIGMKKEFKTVIDETAFESPTILVSGGHVEMSIELKPEALLNALTIVKTADIRTEQALG